MWVCENMREVQHLYVQVPKADEIIDKVLYICIHTVAMDNDNEDVTCANLFLWKAFLGFSTLVWSRRENFQHLDMVSRSRGPPFIFAQATVGSTSFGFCVGQ